MKKNYTLLGLFFTVFAFAQTPTIVWNYALPDRIDRTNPAIAEDGTIYIACDYVTRNTLTYATTPRNIFAINPNGTLKWEAPVNEGTLLDKVDQIQSSPSVGADGSIYIGGHFSRRMFRFNAASGDTLRTMNIGSRIRYTAPAFATNGDVYVLGRNNNDRGVRNLKADLSAQNWVFGVGIDFNSTPAIALDGTIYAVSTNLSIYAINPDGTQKWTAVYGETGGYASSAIALGNDGTVYLSAKLNAAGDGVLKAYNPTNGTEKWSVTLTGTNVEQGGPSVAADGTIYLGNNGGVLSAYNPTDGTVKWSFTASGGIEVVPAIDNFGRIYFGTTTGNFYVLNSDGTEAYDMLDLGDIINSSVAIDKDGRIYVAATDAGVGKLYALTTTATGLQTGGWPMYGGNARHTSNANDATLSTTDISAIEGFNVYPNPVNNEGFYISSNLNGVKSIEIFNMLGKQVYSKNIENYVQIKTTDLTAGIYILRVTIANKVATTKLIIK